jgi:hypothetical protein
MTDRTRDEQLDRAIRSFLARQAEDIADAPTATEMAVRIGAGARTRTVWLRPVPLRAWVLLGLLLVALLGAAVIGAALLRHDPVRASYDAVFLRLAVVSGRPEVLVVGVDTRGAERQIARLPGAWVAYRLPLEGRYVPPMGAVSSGGLLAIPTGSGGQPIHWEIFDLHHPQLEPILVAGIAQDVEELQATAYFKADVRPSVFWGPGDRLAIPWYDRLTAPNAYGSGLDWHLGFVDGRTGTATSVDYPENLFLLPDWASDGSGVFVGSAPTDVDPRRVLRRDGTVVDGTAAGVTSSCRTHDQSGAPIAIDTERVLAPLVDHGPEPAVSAVGVGFACLAPDDSTIALSVDFGTGTSTVAEQRVGLIAPGSGAWSEIQGTFAGWLEVDR